MRNNRASIIASVLFITSITACGSSSGGSSSSNNTGPFDGRYAGNWNLVCPSCGNTGDTASGPFTTTLVNGVFTGTLFTITQGSHGIVFTSGTVSSSGAITAAGNAPPACSNSVSTFTGQIVVAAGGAATMTMTYSRPATVIGCPEAESGIITATRQ